MKRLLLTYLFLLFSSVIYSQVGINTNSPDPSSALDIQSTNSGILIPRLTQDQRDAIASPATGLLIFQTNESAGFYFYNGEEWTRIEGAGFEQNSEAAAEGITEVIAGYGLSGGGNTGQVTLDIDFTTFTAVMPGLSDYVVGFDQTGESLIRISDILDLAPEGNPGPAGPQGEQGEQGVRGDDGIDGPTGPQGPQGEQGPAGPQGPQGVAGTDGTNGTNGADGAQGPQGEQGPAGPAGPTGPQGPQGVAGTEGADGIDGTNGLSAYETWLSLGNTGTEQDFIDSLIGPQGEQGVNGSDGNISLGNNLGDMLYWDESEWVLVENGQTGMILHYCYGVPKWGPCYAQVVLLSINEVNGFSANFNAEIIDDGGSDIIEKGFCYSNSSNPTISDFVVSYGAGIGEFSSVISNLNPNTNYFVRAYATNTAGTIYSNELVFTSGADLPSVITNSVSNISNDSAYVSGEVIDSGGGVISQRGFCYSTSDQPTLDNSVEISDLGSGVGVFTNSINNLTAGTTYYVRAFAVNETGVSYGDQISFFTENEVLPLSCNSCGISTSSLSSPLMVDGIIYAYVGQEIYMTQPACCSTCYIWCGASYFINPDEANQISFSCSNGSGPVSQTISFDNPGVYYVTGRAGNSSVRTCTVSIVITEPPSSYALSFEPNNYVAYNNIPEYNNLNSMTIEFWVYLNNHRDEHIIGTEFFATGWHINQSALSVGGADDNIWLTAQDGVPWISTGEWTHVAMQFNHNAPIESQLNLYINGILVLESNVPDGQLQNGIGDGGRIAINRHTWNGGSSSRYSGMIDEVRLSNISRYNGNFNPLTSQLQNDENTLLLLNFEDSSNPVMDSSQYQNTGHVTGNISIIPRN